MSGTGEEIAKGLLLLGGVGGDGLDGERLALKYVGDDGDGVGGGGEDVGALDGLGPVETEDVVDDVDTGLGILVAGNVCNVASRISLELLMARDANRSREGESLQVLKSAIVSKPPFLV